MTPTTKAQIEALFKSAIYTYLATPGFYSELPHRLEGLCEEYAEKALTALASIEEGGGWLDISTAPMDWTPVILFSPEYEVPHPDDMGEYHEARVYAGYYSNGDYGGSNQWFEGRHPVNVQPTLWQPLPPPPRKADEVRG